MQEVRTHHAVPFRFQTWLRHTLALRPRAHGQRRLMVAARESCCLLVGSLALIGALLPAQLPDGRRAAVAAGAGGVMVAGADRRWQKRRVWLRYA